MRQKIGLKANRSKRVKQTFRLSFVEFPCYLTHQEEFICDSFFAPLKHKYLGRSKRNLEKTILSIYDVFGERYIEISGFGLFSHDCVQQLS